MSRPVFLFSCLTLVACVLWMTGCEPPENTADSAPNGEHEGHDHGDHEGHDHGDKQSSADLEKIKKNLALLSDEDRAAAEKQKICPVTKSTLGSHGQPIKLDVEGQSVFICCAGCKDPLLKEPAKYLANLKK